MSKRVLLMIVVAAVCMLFLFTAAEAKDWTKKDFEQLPAEERVFHLTSLELSINGYDFRLTMDKELGIILKNKNNTVPAAIPMDELIKSVETKYGVTIDKSEFEQKYSERMEKGFFKTEPKYSGEVATYEWSLANQKNRLAVSIYLFKIGSRVQKNKAQFTIQLLKYDPEADNYQVLTTDKSKRITWKKQLEIYEIIKNHCIIK